MIQEVTLKALAEITGRLVRERLQPLIDENAALLEEVRGLSGRVADLEEQATNPRRPQ